MVEKRVFTLSQIAQHKSNKDCWLVINGRVLNVTSFFDDHPGGEEVLLEVAGKDVTKEFIDIGHSNAAQNMLDKYQVGILQASTINEEGVGKGAPVEEPKKKEMSAFVIKDGHKPKYAALLEFFVPLLVTGSYFSYRYLSNAAQTV